jgi:CheY-like chemotaxis protein
LPVAKKMAEAMGGGLTLERDAARGVTVFKLRLPLFPGVDEGNDPTATAETPTPPLTRATSRESARPPRRPRLPALRLHASTPRAMMGGRDRSPVGAAVTTTTTPTAPSVGAGVGALVSPGIGATTAEYESSHNSALDRAGGTTPMHVSVDMAAVTHARDKGVLQRLLAAVSPSLDMQEEVIPADLALGDVWAGAEEPFRGRVLAPLSGAFSVHSGHGSAAESMSGGLGSEARSLDPSTQSSPRRRVVMSGGTAMQRHHGGSGGDGGGGFAAASDGGNTQRESGLMGSGSSSEQVVNVHAQTEPPAAASASAAAAESASLAAPSVSAPPLAAEAPAPLPAPPPLPPRPGAPALLTLPALAQRDYPLLPVGGALVEAAAEAAHGASAAVIAPSALRVEAVAATPLLLPAGSPGTPAELGAAAGAGTATPLQSAATARGGESGTPGSLAGLRFLYADDERVNCAMMARMLRRLGGECVTVDDGSEVLPALTAAGQIGAGAVSVGSQRRFDAVLLDIVMRVQCGDETCALLRRLGVRLPIVACTGNADPDLLGRAGFDDVVEKPFTAQRLERVLLRHLGRTASGAGAVAGGAAGGGVGIGGV